MSCRLVQIALAMHLLLITGCNFGALDVSDLIAAFESNDGLTLRVADPGEHRADEPVSASVWRTDLPLALYTPVRANASDEMGIIFAPSRTHVVCAYPVNSNSIERISPANESAKDPCGVSPSIWTDGMNSGECSFTTAEEYADAYYFKPLVPLLGMRLWTLEMATCHFKSVPLMLDAQRLLLLRSMNTPQGTTENDWLNNATKIGFGLTAFNEVMHAPFEASSVGGIFWAHSGPFRAPHAKEYGACQIAEYLRSLPPGARPFPLFELAEVTLERPFSGCEAKLGLKPMPASDCLSRGFREWRANLSEEGHWRNTTDVFRVVSEEVFLAPQLACAFEEQHVPYFTILP